MEKHQDNQGSLYQWEVKYKKRKGKQGTERSSWACKGAWDLLTGMNFLKVFGVITHQEMMHNGVVA